MNVGSMHGFHEAVHNYREFGRNLDLRVQVHPGEFWVSKQPYYWVHIVLEASKSAGAKGDIPKITGLCTHSTRANAFPEY